MTEKITCQVCGAQTHSIQKHLMEAHPEITLDAYRERFPAAPLLSDYAKERLAAKRAAAAAEGKSPVIAEQPAANRKQFLHEVFNLGSAPAALSASGKPIPISVLEHIEGEYGSAMVPDVDPGYVFNIDLLKTILMCLEMNLPCYLWGHMGTGKTTAYEQACAYTKRPTIRIQHTLNTEEAHIVGQWIYRNGQTEWQPGWLSLAMKFGMTYIADEYDIAIPHVLALYQPVLEGKALVVKDAAPEWRIIKPHPNFRFLATGNTNGTGDSTGLYQGTQLQNAANYERFAVVQKVEFMEPGIEKRILMAKCGVSAKDAESLIKYATKIRQEVDKNSVSTPITPRSLLNAARLGIVKGDFKLGLALAYINRLTPVEQEVARQLAQREFG